MIDKRIATAREAVADIADGSTILIGGFGEAGSPIELIHALIDQGATGLTVVNNNTGSGEVGLAAAGALVALDDSRGRSHLLRVARESRDASLRARAIALLEENDIGGL